MSPFIYFNLLKGTTNHRRHRVVSLSKTYLFPRVLVNLRKRWLGSDMIEELLTVTLSLNP